MDLDGDQRFNEDEEEDEVSCKNEHGAIHCLKKKGFKYLKYQYCLYIKPCFEAWKLNSYYHVYRQVLLVFFEKSWKQMLILVIYFCSICKCKACEMFGCILVDDIQYCLIICTVLFPSLLIQCSLWVADYFSKFINFKWRERRNGVWGCACFTKNICISLKKYFYLISFEIELNVWINLKKIYI